MWLGTEENQLNERRHSNVINPGAKSTSSPSAQGKNTKGSQQRRLSSCFVFLRYSSPMTEEVKNSLLMLQMERWKSAKKALWGEREKAFQANCGSFSYIVYQHARCCLSTLFQQKPEISCGQLWGNELCRKWKHGKICTQHYFWKGHRTLSTFECASVIRSTCQVKARVHRYNTV